MGNHILRTSAMPVALWGAVLVLSAAGCAMDDRSSSQKMEGATDGIIDCVVPGQIRQLDEKVTYPTQRQVVRVTREECRVRGGEEK